MAERAAHLVDHVFPDVPVRQWVLPLPCRLRYQLAWNHDLCRAVTAVTMRAILKRLQDQARENAQVDELIMSGVLRRLLALTELQFSNSLIEAWSRSSKHQWLYLHSLGS